MASRSSRTSLLVLGGGLLLWSAAPLTAQDVPELANLRITDGELLTSKDGAVYGEALRLPAELPALLAELRPGIAATVLELPLAPGVRRSVRLQRVDVYARGARIWRQDESGLHELPRSSRLYFQGADPADPQWRVGLWLDPVSGALGGVTAGAEGDFRLEAEAEDYRLVKADHGLPESQSSCATGDSERITLPWDGPVFLDRSHAVHDAPVVTKASVSATYQAVIAVDTDNEFLWERFGNDKADATDWIAELFLGMNVFYERDLSLRLLQGDTFLRTDPDAPSNFDQDPWNIETAGASSTHLNAFGNYWDTQYDSIDRVFAMLLSGKSSSGFSASGIAWVGGNGYTPGFSTGSYCSTSIGYSYSQVFTYPGFGGATSAELVGHEVGHNAGSTHTHCYPSPVDTCYNGQSGCWPGSESCPAGGGTVMSYCHLLGSCGVEPVFHPTVQANLTTNIAAEFPGCIETYASIFTDGFESGNVSVWDSSIP